MSMWYSHWKGIAIIIALAKSHMVLLMNSVNLAFRLIGLILWVMCVCVACLQYHPSWIVWTKLSLSVFYAHLYSEQFVHVALRSHEKSLGVHRWIYVAFLLQHFVVRIESGTMVHKVLFVSGHMTIMQMKHICNNPFIMQRWTQHCIENTLIGISPKPKIIGNIPQI